MSVGCVRLSQRCHCLGQFHKSNSRQGDAFLSCSKSCKSETVNMQLQQLPIFNKLTNLKVKSAHCHLVVYFCVGLKDKRMKLLMIKKTHTHTH